MEGPRGVREEDMPSLRALTGIVMRPELVDQYPQLFNPANYENLRVCADGDKLVAHVGMTQRDAVVHGCRIRTACIGGVCTLPEYRKQGLASACFDDALAKAGAEGVDLMIVSGDRNLYRMRGCVHVGGDTEYDIARDAVPAAWRERASAVTIAVMRPEELPLVEQQYRTEPVRFDRPRNDYDFALNSGYVMNRPSDFLVVREAGEFKGYVIAAHRGKEGGARLAEICCEPHALAGAVPHILDRYDLTSISLHAMRHKPVLRTMCEEAGLTGTPRSTPGTVTLVNLPQMMERLRPLVASAIGEQRAAALQFRQSEDAVEICLGEERLETNRAEAARLLFGTREGAPEIAAGLPGALADALGAALPLPTLWYGINYV